MSMSETPLRGQIINLPYGLVVREAKVSIKVRMIFDGSSLPTFLPYLNDWLYPGLSLTSYLYGIILRFRAHVFPFIAHIENAFIQFH